MNFDLNFSWYDLFLFLFFSVPFLLTNWVLFKKASQPGWAAITPVYGFLVYAKIAKTNKYTAFFAGLIYLFTFVPVDPGEIEPIEVALGLTYIVALIIQLMMFIKFYKKYEISGWFWLEYIFLPIAAVFRAKDAKYVGGEVLKSKQTN